MTRLAPFYVCLLLLTGCTSSPEDQRYNADAFGHDFGFFFHSREDVHTFMTLSEANDFIRAAQLKLPGSIGKASIQGLAARLIGSSLTDSSAVTVVHIFTASNPSSPIELGEIDEKLKVQLQQAPSVGSVFLVFFNERGVSISDFYLDHQYRYASNSQYKSFTFRHNNYATDYAGGWRTDQAIRYLNRELE